MAEWLPITSLNPETQREKARGRQIFLRSENPAVYSQIAELLASGYALTMDNLRAIYLSNGYSPASSKNFITQAETGRFTRETGVTVSGVRINNQKVFFNGSLAPKDTDLEVVAAEVLTQKVIKRKKGKIINGSQSAPTSPSRALKVENLINEPGFPFSVARITVTGTNEPTINSYCDTTYYVIDGKGRFIIDGQEQMVEPGELVVIPRETPYLDYGEPVLGLLAVSWPRFPGNFG